MAGSTLALTLVVTILLVYNTNYSVYCINTQCQGTECTQEDLDTTTGEKVLQNLTSTISKILESQLRIHITHDYNNSSCKATSKPARAPPVDITPQYAQDCGDIAAQGHNKSGVYRVRPKIHPVVSSTGTVISDFEVYCDLESDDGAWTVFQRRQDGLVDFNRFWGEYKRGFGYFESEFWLGLDKLQRLTTQDHYRLKVIVEDANGDTVYETYDNFRIGDESSSFKLHLGAHEGTALSHAANMRFSTKDNDNDPHSGHCAQLYKSGWWFDQCHDANLNGWYLTPGVVASTGITWYQWKDNTYETLKSTEMKICRME